MSAERYNDLMNLVPLDIRPLVPGFLERREKEAKELWEWLKMTDFGAIKDAGHKLKGTGAGYGFQLVTDIGRDLELAAKDQHFERVKDAIARLEETTRNLKRVLRDRPDF